MAQQKLGQLPDGDGEGLPMTNEATLRQWQRFGLPPTCERQLIHSHLQAYAEIRRLRSALHAVLETLDAVDGDDFDKAVAGLGRLDDLHRKPNATLRWNSTS